ncbi:Peroxisomal membrane protein PMP27 [Apophysomyces sp. BC1034]|nr:Peroxisomal membrane protein PMP27 [Apophysomyces sp. BC1015]KAG0182748.1 Peroxisomal membrane protein PMP27 [Apophysomyces sp. BC1021]KAG0186152.1 Peroxisomal membrane protein PMP27 [Apophysomyces sp. BC1034]
MVTHAQVDAFNRYLNTTVGREKLCRLVQYFSRFYVFYLLRTGAPKDVVARWENLKQHIANGRKFFRLLKPVEFAQAGVKGLSLEDQVLRAATVIKQAGMFFYYSSEVFVLTTAINFYKPDKLKEITTFGQKCWFTAIAASFLSGLYKYKQIKTKAAQLEKRRKAGADVKAESDTLHRNSFATKYSLVLDAVDIVIPSANLGWLPVDEGVVGIAGMITSAMAMHTQWVKLNG